MHPVTGKCVTGVRDQISYEAFDLLRMVSGSPPFPRHWLWYNNAREVQMCTRTGADGLIVGSTIIEIVERNFEDTDTMVRMQD